jgi:hypothetical protein
LKTAPLAALFRPIGRGSFTAETFRSLLTAYYLPLTAYYLPFIAYCLLLTA